MDPSVSTRVELSAVRVRRAELRETMNLIEAALAAPARGRAVVWGEAVHASLVMLADDFGAHVEVTEGPGGLHHAILTGDLRLANAVMALTDEHAQIAEVIASLVADSAAPVGETDVDDLRERATDLLGHLVRHRQRGADLIYEAYETDIGGGD
jgi:UDP-N-acetylglucosamine enolpyruvyl transferase